MEKKLYTVIIEELRTFDPFNADCIQSSIEGIMETYKRSLTEDELMIAFSMFLSGMMAEKFSSINKEIDESTAINKMIPFSLN